ncbi:hypothetical protein Sgleb_47550 [Streptomyces glebosus]|uniref:Gram-positive cocci surface proteins LPxTG domain-containing protein n=1 Tax=Streptomyces glebosus TaxID=249580 RepID=A0A640T078_9ACTN|nr:hypothetical protein Sgleb_47550 [Streptomyces glebosus]GHG90318.1 hypothetical protein GCM10010513_73280 [Streptomyces glebosus]
MRSRQLALCAAVAACAVTTAPAPAYGADDRATGTATAQATHASRGTGGTAGRAIVRSVAVYEGSPRTWTGGSLIAGPVVGADHIRSGSATGTYPASLAPAAETGRAGAAAYAAKGAGASRATHAARAANATKESHPAKESHAASSRELSSTSAVGLVLAGGAILVIAGQLLRLRLRLRRERRGDADER